MRKLVPFAVLLAVPAQAQDARLYYASDTWPVHVSDRTCTMARTMTDASGTFTVAYDGAEITLTSANEVESALPESGKVDLAIVFLANGDTDYDPGWGLRQFSYEREDAVYRFSARFAGERNVRQLLADLTGSEWIGLLQRGKPIISYPLDGIGPSIARLRDCAARSVAAN